MNYSLAASAALEKRSALIAELRSVNADKTLTDSAKTERAARISEDIDQAETEARAFVEAGEREAEVRHIAGRSGLVLATGNTPEKRYGAGEWLAGELRALTGASGAGAAFTPEENARHFWDKFVPRSVLLASGVNLIRTDRDALNIPRILTDPVADFVAEATTLPGTDGTADTVTATPRKIAHLTAMSNEILADSDPALLDVYGMQIMRVLALRYDLGSFEGTGTAPSIRGLKAVSGINNSSMGTNGATPTNLDFIADALGVIETNNAEGRAIVMHPRTWQTLSKIKSVSGGSMPVLMEQDGSGSQGLKRSLYGVPVHLSSQLSVTETQGSASNASSVYVYDPSAIYAVVRQDVRVELDSSRLFNSDQSEVRGIMRADTVVSQPSAVVRVAGLLP